MKKTKGNKNKRKARFNADKVAANVERGKAGGGGGWDYIKLPSDIEFFKPEYAEKKETATYRFIIVPFYTGMTGKFSREVEAEGDLWYRANYRRASLGSENKKVVSLTSIGKKCPINDMYNKLKDELAGSNPELLKAFASSKREIYYVIDIAEWKKTKELTVRVLDFSQHLFGKKLDLEIKSEEYEDKEEFPFNPVLLADPEEGCVVKIQFKKETYRGNVYSDVGKVSLEERKKGLPVIDDDLIEELQDPMEFLEILPYKEINSIILDNDDDLDTTSEIDDDDDLDYGDVSNDDDDEGDEDDDDPTVDLDAMNRKELKQYIKEEELDITVKKKWDEEDIRDAIQEALEAGSDDDDDDDDDEVGDDDDDFYDD